MTEDPSGHLPHIGPSVSREAARDELPVLSAEILCAPSEGGGVVYDLITRELSFLNASAFSICEACATATPRSRLIGDLVESTGQPSEQLARDVDGFIDHLVAANMIGRTESLERSLPDAPITPLDPGEHSYQVDAGVHRIRFRSRNRPLIDRIEATLEMPAARGEPSADFSLEVQDHGGVLLRTDTEWRFPTPTELFDRLVTVLNDFVARTTTELVLHAGAVRSPDGVVIVLAGPPGSGKSTLVGALVKHGWDYLADESVTVCAGDLAVLGCPKPLTLDPTSCQALALTSCGPNVPVSELSTEAIRVNGPAAAPTLLVFPTFQHDSRPNTPGEVIPVEGNDLTVTLVANSLNLAYARGTGLGTLNRLADSVPAYRMHYGTSAEAIELIEAAIDAVTPAVETRHR